MLENGFTPGTEPEMEDLKETSMAIRRASIPAMTLNKKELDLAQETILSVVVQWNNNATEMDRFNNEQLAQSVLSEILNLFVQIGKNKEAA
jgi:hypothetical protein